VHVRRPLRPGSSIRLIPVLLLLPRPRAPTPLPPSLLCTLSSLTLSRRRAHKGVVYADGLLEQLLSIRTFDRSLRLGERGVLDQSVALYNPPWSANTKSDPAVLPSPLALQIRAIHVLDIP